uniref:Uncharacterized protein n=1 Tax=Utricularia reniformis TaxID=192314 RepID=A0A1Y0AZB7_9LAMI|nr:hypothetical protein AEK19_MT0204 [Utricularia reniformis]ART30483.1 hypothetical protein AEK19_MT0204 [Utricularia reniformis]
MFRGAVTQTYLRGGMPCKESEPWYFHLTLSQC